MCGVGQVMVGGDAPVVVQSMTNTDTADIAATVNQVADLAHCRLRSWCVSPSTARRRRARCLRSARGWTRAV